MLNLDTHILLFAFQGRLTSRERSVLTSDTWSISGIVLWEIAKLVELGRVELDLDDPQMVRAISGIHTWPITLDVCRAIGDLDFRGEPADELIGATSLVFGVPLVTRDRRLRQSKVVPLAG